MVKLEISKATYDEELIFLDSLCTFYFGVVIQNLQYFLLLSTF
jgi:hypothetical protein